MPVKFGNGQLYTLESRHIMRENQAEPSHWPQFCGFAAVFVLSLTITLAQIYLGASPLDHLYSDMHGYIERARRLAGGHPRHIFDVFYPPGAHYFYAVWFFLFPRSAMTLLPPLQALLVAAANLFLGLAAASLYGSARLGLLAALGCTLYWPFTAQASFFMAEPPFMFLLTLSLLLFFRAARGAGHSRYFWGSGLLLGAAALVKVQALCAFLPLGLSFFIFGAHRLRLRKSIGLFAGFALPIAAQLAANSYYAGRPIFYISANDTFNFYLGQSRRTAVGCLDREQNLFYVFYNNNAALDFPFFPPEVLPVSIVDREYFAQRTKQLWQDNPRRQLLRSLENMRELFVINPRWPLRNVPKFRRLDIWSQWLLLLLVAYPALAVVCSAPFTERYREAAFLSVLPVASMAAVAFVSTGQPRYLLPFQYYYFLLAPAVYADLRARFSGRGGGVSPLLPRRAYVTALLVLAVAVIFGKTVGYAHLKTMPPAASALQDNYSNRPQLGAGVGAQTLWFEFGRDNQLISALHDQPAATGIIQLSGFRIGRAWPRPVSWHAEAHKEGLITIDLGLFPANAVFLYLTDGERNGNAVRALSGQTDVFADQMHNGKWLFFPVTEEERRYGQKSIILRTLIGDRISISALHLVRTTSAPPPQT